MLSRHSYLAALAALYFFSIVNSFPYPYNGKSTISKLVVNYMDSTQNQY